MTFVPGNPASSKFREFHVGDPTGPYPFPFEQLEPKAQIITLDTNEIAGIALLPEPNLASPNQEITIVSIGGGTNQLIITLVAPGGIIASNGSLLQINEDNIATTFKSDGRGNWVLTAQTQP